MQAYDLIMLVVLAMATIFGAIKGFAWQVASLASIVVSYLVAYNFRFEVAKMIHAQPPWNLFLAMLLLYVGSSFVIWVGFRLLSSAIDGVRLKEFDRHLGAGFGLAKGLIYCLLITMFAMTLLGPKQQAAICQSKSGYYMANALDKASGILPKELHEVVGPYLAKLDEKLHQKFPESEMNSAGGLQWPSNWGSSPGSGASGGTNAGGLGGVLPHSTSEQGGGGGWGLDRLWPGNTTPQPAGNPQLPQNFPPMISPPSNGFGMDSGSGNGTTGTGLGLPSFGTQNGTQQAQQPAPVWPR